MRKITVALLLAFALVITPSMAAAESWQTVETWSDELKTPTWQTVETWTNYTEVTYVVGKPILVSPDNNSTISDNTPTFNWIAGTNASSQRLLLDDDSDFSSPIENVIRSGAAMNYTIAAPGLSDDNYWWKVIAILSDLENSSGVYNFELISPAAKNWQTIETWEDSLKFKGWENVEIWTTYVSVIEMGDYLAKGVNYLHQGVAAIVDDPPFEFLWKKNILGSYDEFSGPIVVGSKIWIANKGDKIFRCLGLKYGSEIWSYQLNAETDGAPVWFDNMIYVGTGNGAASLYCFDADSGNNLWRYDGVPYGFTSSPWINTDNRIIYWVDGRYLYALGADNGNLIWSDDLGLGNHPFVGVYYDGICYSPGKNGSYTITAYDAENGDPIIYTPEDWWNGNWSYRASITLTIGENVPPENYQYKIVLDKVDNLNNYCLDNFQDIRFLEDIDSGELSFWIENYISGDTATFWFKREENSLSDNQIYVYFGNASAGSVGDGDATFIQYHGAASAAFHDDNVVSMPFIYEAHVRQTSGLNTLWGLSEDGNLNVTSGDAISILSNTDGSKRYFKAWDDGSQSFCWEVPALTDDEWYFLTIVTTAASAHAYVGVNEIASGITTNIPDEMMGLTMEFTGGGTGEQKYSFVREYVSPEPSGLLGGIESTGGEWPSINYPVWDSGITVDTSNAENIRLYVATSNPAKVFCLDPKSGETYWVKTIHSYTTNRYMLGVPAVWENKIYVTSGGGAGNKGVYCLHAENGEIKWKWAGTSATTVYTSVTVLPSGKIIYVTHGGTVHIRDADNGSMIWAYGMGQTSFGGHVAVADGIFLAITDGYLWAFGSAVGYEWQTAEMWNTSMKVEEPPPPPPGPPPEEFVWVVFAIRFLSVFGPFGFVAWQFTKIKDPTSGVHAAVWVAIGAVAFVLLWFVAYAVETVLYAM